MAGYRLRPHELAALSSLSEALHELRLAAPTRIGAIELARRFDPNHPERWAGLLTLHEVRRPRASSLQRLLVQGLGYDEASAADPMDMLLAIAGNAIAPEPR